MQASRLASKQGKHTYPIDRVQKEYPHQVSHRNANNKGTLPSIIPEALPSLASLSSVSSAPADPLKELT
jgi:hypothetical protein